MNAWMMIAATSVGLSTAMVPLEAIANSTLATPTSPTVTQSNPPSLSSPWQPASPEEQQQIQNYILNSPLGIAALNQLAIEGFINPTCTKTYYTHQQYETFQTLLRVQCPSDRGVSIARSYREVRVTFNRFEDNIESFDIERVYEDGES